MTGASSLGFIGIPLPAVRPEQAIAMPAPISHVAPTRTVCHAPSLPPLAPSHFVKWLRSVPWLLGTLLSLLVFVMPIHSLEAITTLEVPADIPEAQAEVGMRTVSVLILLVATAFPVLWSWEARCMAAVSLVMAAVFWSILLVEDDLMVDWFRWTFLVVAIVVPLLVVGGDAALKTRAALN